MYRDNLFKKIVLTKPQTLERFQEYDKFTMSQLSQFNTLIEPVEDLSLRNGLKFI